MQYKYTDAFSVHLLKYQYSSS